MANPTPRFIKLLRWGFLGVLLMTIPMGHVAGSEGLSDVSLQSQSDRQLLLFPAHRIEEILVQKPMAEMVMVDLPYFNIDASPRVLVAPHPRVRLMRLSQVSRQPDVVRAAFLFHGDAWKPVVRDGHLYLEEPSLNAGSSRGMDESGMSAGVPVPASTGNQARSIGGEVALHRGERPSSILDERVNLDFDDEDLSTILNALGMKFGLRIFADSGVKGKFTVHAKETPLRDVLKNLLLQRSFQYTLKGRDLTVISLGQGTGRVARELLFKDLSLRDALQTLSKMMNVNLILHESVTEKAVNFYVENLNLDELLDLLVKTNDLVKQPYNENTYVIIAKDKAKDYGKRTYRTFKLVNAKPEEIIKMIQGSKSLADRIDTANIAVNERISALSVYETPENLELIASIISNVDEKLKQAVIEVKLLEINRTGLKQLGVSLDNYSVKTSDIARLPKSVTIGATLDFLEKENKAKVLASPKIRAVHGKKATIQIGEIIPVPYFRYEVASSSYIGYVPQTFKEYRDVNVGIELSVMPEISRDNEISLELNTKVDSVLDINQDGQIHKSNRSTSTYVRIKDGETVVLGGLISQNDSTTKQSPSMLNKVPLLRGLLTNNRVDMRDSEMIMLVTPHLVNLDTFDTPDQARPGLYVEKIDGRGRSTIAGQ